MRQERSVTESALFRIDVDRHPKHTVLMLAGELDMTVAPRLEQCLDPLLDSGVTRIVLDLSALNFCDSSGLARFVAAANRCRAAGGWLRLAAPQERVTRVLGIAGLLAALPAYASRSAAVDDLADERITDERITD
jgi:anti-sigma B factor antagonist